MLDKAVHAAVGSEDLMVTKRSGGMPM